MWDHKFMVKIPTTMKNKKRERKST